MRRLNGKFLCGKIHFHSSSFPFLDGAICSPSKRSIHSPIVRNALEVVVLLQRKRKKIVFLFSFRSFTLTRRFRWSFSRRIFRFGPVDHGAAALRRRRFVRLNDHRLFERDGSSRVRHVGRVVQRGSSVAVDRLQNIRKRNSSIDRAFTSALVLICEWLGLVALTIGLRTSGGTY